MATSTNIDDEVLKRMEWILPFVNPDTAHEEKCCKDTTKSNFCDGLLKVNRIGQANGTIINKKQDKSVYINKNNIETENGQIAQTDKACTTLL